MKACSVTVSPRRHGPTQIILHAVLLWSSPRHISVSLSLCVLAVFSPTMPSLSILRFFFVLPIINILSLSLHNSGDQSPVAMAMEPPKQVCVFAWLLWWVRACSLAACRLYLLLHQSERWGLRRWRRSPAPPLPPPPPPPPPARLSGRDALTCHTWLPLGSVQNNDQIQRGEKKRNTRTAVRPVLFLSS